MNTSTNIKMMRFYAKLAALFLILTYVVTVNMELSLFALDCPWLSNNFFLTVFGGVFTGIVLSFMIECKQYILNKRTTEDSLYAHAAFLFGQLQIAQNSINLVFEHKDQGIPTQLLSSSAQSIQCACQALRNIEYSTIHPKSPVRQNHDNYISNTYATLLDYTTNCNHLPIIISEERLKLAYADQHGSIVSADIPAISLALSKLLNETNAALDKIDQYLNALDTACSCRYQWCRNKEILVSGLIASSKKPFDT